MYRVSEHERCHVGECLSLPFLRRGVDRSGEHALDELGVEIGHELPNDVGSPRSTTLVIEGYMPDLVQDHVLPMERGHPTLVEDVVTCRRPYPGTGRRAQCCLDLDKSHWTAPPPLYARAQFGEIEWPWNVEAIDHFFTPSPELSYFHLLVPLPSEIESPLGASSIKFVV
jgi:hypothetical protein